MKKNAWKKREGVVFSTNPEYGYTNRENPQEESVPMNRQLLRVELDRSGRAGKQVTVVSGFTGSEADREAMCRFLKSRCGVGGSVKGNDILVQGDVRTKVGLLLSGEGCKVKVV